MRQTLKKITFNDMLKKAHNLITSEENVSTENLQEAEKIIIKIFNDYPNESVCWHAFANLELKKSNYVVASNAFLKTLELGVKDKNDEASVWGNLGVCYSRMQDEEKAKEAFEKALNLTPNNHDCMTNISSSYIHSANPEKGIPYCEKSLKIKETRNARMNLSIAQLRCGNYKDGFNNYDYRKIYEGNQEREYLKSKDGKSIYWDGKPDKKKNVVIYGEQGLGDELIFSQLLEEANKHVNVIFDAHPRLADLFRFSFMEKGLDIPVFGTRKNQKLFWTRFFNIDAQLPIGSLAKLYWNKEDKIKPDNFLKVKDTEGLIERTSYLTNICKKELVIGFAWQGGINTTAQKHRICPLELWKPLFDLDAVFISFQYHANAENELNSFLEKNPQYKDKIIHDNTIIDDYDITAYVVNNYCDFIVSVPQSIVHLSALLNQKVIQLCPREGLWQMGVIGKNAPWHSTVTNIWQRTSNDYAYCINEAIKLIKDKI